MSSQGKKYIKTKLDKNEPVEETKEPKLKKSTKDKASLNAERVNLASVIIQKHA